MGDQNTTTKRKRVSVACTACRKAHVKCDAGRPCTRCVKKGIAHMCKTATSKRRGRKNLSKKVRAPNAGGAKIFNDITKNLSVSLENRRVSKSKIESLPPVMSIEEAGMVLLMLSDGLL
eukprot:TRINITY_DN11497_c0_g1_i1.p1 TRINITY_DN11497_c0_g1~~TRINITY_DN11497_c0_g1_i1.p1  ORF type:complete len:119 (-),score=16.45 TRINITY_DN11497_c0_g1_i1:166-522(-)